MASRVLVLETGYDRSALAACRALAGAGWEVGVGGRRRDGIAAASRFASRTHEVPAPGAGGGAFVAAVNEAVAAAGYELLISGSGNVEFLALSALRDRLDAEVPLPPHEVVLAVTDKASLRDAARAVGLPVPRAAPGGEEALERLGPPWVIKARVGGDPALEEDRRAFLSTRFEDAAAALERIERVRALGGEPIVQEAVEGDLIALCVVADRASRIVARSQQRALAVWPPRAGVSAAAETVPVDPVLAGGVQDLVAEVGWTGIAELQFIAPRGGEPLLIDFNGRPYGSLALAVAAGANLPHLWLSRASPPAPVDARPGVRYQWLEGDLRRAFAERRRGGRGVLSTLAFALPPTRHSVISVRDPRPALRALRSLASRAWRR